jgi:hypothetical protein
MKTMYELLKQCAISGADFDGYIPHVLRERNDMANLEELGLVRPVGKGVCHECADVAHNGSPTEGQVYAATDLGKAMLGDLPSTELPGWLSDRMYSGSILPRLIRGLPGLPQYRLSPILRSLGRTRTVSWLMGSGFASAKQAWDSATESQQILDLLVIPYARYDAIRYLGAEELRRIYSFEYAEHSLISYGFQHQYLFVERDPDNLLSSDSLVSLSRWDLPGVLAGYPLLEAWIHW